MKLAVISVTRNGAELAARLQKILPGPVALFAKAGRHGRTNQQEYDSLSELVSAIFSNYDGLIFIMSTGIVVRVIAPFVQDKRYDPAVVVMDDLGRHVVSLLSGHIGGANELTRSISQLIGADPVITTATDIANRPAADILAVKLNLVMEPFEKMKTINAAIAAGERVRFFIDPELPDRGEYAVKAAALGIQLEDMGQLAQDGLYDAAVIITSRELDILKPHLYLRPACLAAGIGCRRGVPGAEILAALKDACREAGHSIKSVAVLGSTVVKNDEVGLLSAAEQLEIPIEFFSNEQIQTKIDSHGLETSPFVKQQIGVGNVCEPAAMLAGLADRLILPRKKYSKITVALAPVTFRWWE